jgi:uncharacterized protein
MYKYNQEEVLANTKQFVRDTLEQAEAGHDYWHILRVLKSAEKIAGKEGGDLFVIQLGALLHDIADAKFHNGNETLGPKIAEQFLKEQHLPQSIIEQVVNIIKYISFKNSLDGGKVYNSLELQIVQDADRLDAIGAIGIARTFVYGGYKNNPIYDPNIKPNQHLDKATYKKGNAPTINHFYEKLLKLKSMMNTPTGAYLAEERHQFMEAFLNQFYKEWDI